MLSAGVMMGVLASASAGSDAVALDQSTHAETAMIRQHTVRMV